MLRVTENLCDAMTKYNIRPKLPFRYRRGGTCGCLKRAIVKRAIANIFFLFQFKTVKLKSQRKTCEIVSLSFPSEKPLP